MCVPIPESKRRKAEEKSDLDQIEIKTTGDGAKRGDVETQTIAGADAAGPASSIDISDEMPEADKEREIKRAEIKNRKENCMRVN